MKIGIFHPPINRCGGREFVIIKMIDALKKNGFQVVLLSNDKFEKNKVEKVFGDIISVDLNYVFPLQLFNANTPLNLFVDDDWYNIYTDIIRTRVLKSKCDLIIDASTNTIFPYADISYIHYPILQLSSRHIIDKIYYYPFVNLVKNYDKKLVLCNSKYTAKAVKEIYGINPTVLYPPVKIQQLTPENMDAPRNNTVITISRIAKEKKLVEIPKIAKHCKKINFIIVGLLDSINEYQLILRTAKKLNVLDRIKIYPNLSREKLVGLLHSSKVYLHTMVGEHFGISIVEGVASGCIPVVHDSGGAKEYLPADYRYKNIDEAVQKIEKNIYEWSPNKVAKSLKIARKFNEEKFSKDFIRIFRQHYEYMF